MKKIKKMTEERLMHVISESVKRILNEMDPRTYASAREKQNKIDAEYDKRMKDYNGKNVFGRMFSKKPVKPNGYGRGKKFNDAAVNAFNSQYGKDNSNWQTDDRHQTMHDDGSVTQFRPSGDDVFTTSYDFNANQRKAGVKPTGRGIGTVTYGGWNNKTHKDAPKSVRGMENADTDYYYRDGKYKPSFYDKGIKVADQMSFGGGRYEKGKGWVDESQLRRIVNESVKKLLKEEYGKIHVIKKEYTNLGGWDETDWYVDCDKAIKIAANCQRGNANMSKEPEEWAKEKILARKDFKCFKSPELCYIFKFDE